MSYGVEPAWLVTLGGFESFMYETVMAGTKAVLRIGHSGRRDADLVRAEMHWLDHLAARGIGVAGPIRSASGSLVEQVDDGHGERFVAAAFRYAPGRPPETADWGPALWERYGRLLGRLHAAARSYRPEAEAVGRPAWDDPIMFDVVRWLPTDEPQVRATLDHALEAIGELDQPEDAYGLIHQDAHAGNFFVDDTGTITLFDFDDCCYSWFANDLAIVVFYAMSWNGFRDADHHAREFWRHFYPGYRAEHHLDDRWLASMPWFVTLREIDTYAIINRSFGLDDVDDWWAEGFLRERRDSITAGTPLLESGFPL